MTDRDNPVQTQVTERSEGSHITLDDDVDPTATHHSTMIPGRGLHRDTVNRSALLGNDDADCVAAIRRVRLPPFIKDEPDIWFFIIEAEFQASNNKSDQTKYSEAVRALDTETIKHITDILRNPPASNKYDNLKQVILARTSDSREKQIQQLWMDRMPANVKPLLVFGNRDLNNVAENGR